MNEPALNQQETTPEVYERMLVPAIFEQWTQRVADAAGIQAGQRVLDVACGTGVLARAVARRVGNSGSIAGLDLNPEMLAVGRRIAPRIEWTEGDAASLPFPDKSFDAVVSQFGMMFFPDRVQAIAEMKRVLKKGGRLAVAVFDSLERLPAYASMCEVLQRVVGDEAAGALRSPFVLGDTEALLGGFREAGFPSATVASHESTEVFKSIEELVRANVDGWFPLAGIRLDEKTRKALIGETGRALASYVLPAGSVEYEVRVHIVSAGKD